MCVLSVASPSSVTRCSRGVTFRDRGKLLKDRLPPAAPAAKDPRRYGAVARSLIEHVKCVPISWSRRPCTHSAREYFFPGCFGKFSVPSQLFRPRAIVIDATARFSCQRIVTLSPIPCESRYSFTHLPMSRAPPAIGSPHTACSNRSSCFAPSPCRARFSSMIRCAVWSSPTRPRSCPWAGRRTRRTWRVSGPCTRSIRRGWRRIRRTRRRRCSRRTRPGTRRR
mmetsp:Transcript_3364/g.15315  ORF Transcript_3364/g.15315 Transcript_3364/m.15315 type:complete len:224 (-) Transcript_3364:5152-5823(-)